MRAHAGGKLDDAEGLARLARSIGMSGGSINAPMLERVIALCIASDRGDVPGLDAAWDDMVAAHPELMAAPLQHVITGWVESEAGRLDGVRRALAAITRADLARLPRDQEWLATLAQLVMAAVTVDDEATLQAAYDELLPFAGLGCFEGLAAVDRGLVDRFLALAAGHLGDLEAVERHAPAAIAGGEAAGVLVAAHAVADCARAFAAVGVSSRAAELAADAVARFEALGLDHQAGQLRTLLVPAATPDSGTATLVRDGDGWAFTFEGMTVRVRHAKGVADLAVLLANRDRDVHVRTLEGLEGFPSAAAQPALDDAAVVAYRERLRDLESELDEADRHADIERAAKLAAERDALVEELTRSVGLGGRRRSVGSDADERLRKAVSARVKASIARLEQLHPALGRHLRLAVRTGYWCSYVPERPVAWHVEPRHSG
jgi:hypothetical protein